MKAFLKDIYYSFPVQLLLLHFRKYQVLLLLWAVLFSAVNGGFMKTFGVDGLFFSPEYLGEVNFFSIAIVGITLGMLIMAWNVTTFIMHSKRCKFLATTSRPFLKYTINNSLLPLFFLGFYIVSLIRFNGYRELMSGAEISWLVAGLLAGLLTMLLVSFGFFFGADKTIMYRVAPLIANPQKFKEQFDLNNNRQPDGFGIKVGYYFSTGLRLRKARSVSHYSQQYLDLIFKHHHFSAIISIILAFLFLIAIGFLMENKFFQLPSSACIFIFWAVMMAVIGALTYFLQSWSLVFAIGVVVLLNILYDSEIIDPRNKAYGLNYNNKTERPAYTKASLQQLCTPQKIAADKANMLSILEKWKQRQQSEKPLMIFINVSGGGLRSATFTMNTLQKLDSITHGKLMQQTFLISGASGGMLAATYYRELYRSKLHNNRVNLSEEKFLNNITGDLLNPVSTSLITRDIFSPVQKFTIGDNKYVKDRGYAFEEELSFNTNGLLNKQLKDFKADESNGLVPLILFNAVISRDGRKLMAGSQPMSFMMKPKMHEQDTAASPDVIDFGALFNKQQPENIRILSLLRMNATFPYILPNVWLPTNPVIDVMDAGLRDNFGQETTLRFVEYFKDWLDKNTSGVLLIQMRDRVNDNWHQPFEAGGLTDVVTKPATMLQHNWQKLQDYYHNGQYSYISDSTMHRILFMYMPEKEDNAAALNFHLTAREKKNVTESFNNPHNQAALESLLKFIR